MFVKKPEIVWFGGTSPPLFGKKTNYFRFFHLTASPNTFFGIRSGLSPKWQNWFIILFVLLFFKERLLD